jgi:small GTP-binding protein
MAENKISLKVVKLALLGDTTVGKTAICHSMLNLHFVEERLSTIGQEKLETKFVLKNGTEIKLVLWDTAGQERFHSMALKTLKAVQGVIIVFDVSIKKTFQSVNSWLNDIKDNLDDPCLVLFGNKIDKDKSEWEVTKEEVEEYAKSMNLEYFGTSAKTKKGLNEGFSYIVNKAYDRAKRKQSISLEKEEEKFEIVNGCFGKKKKRKKKDKDKAKDKIKNK